MLVLEFLEFFDLTPKPGYKVSISEEPVTKAEFQGRKLLVNGLALSLEDQVPEYKILYPQPNQLNQPQGEL